MARFRSGDLATHCGDLTQDRHLGRLLGAASSPVAPTSPNSTSAAPKRACRPRAPSPTAQKKGPSTEARASKVLERGTVMIGAPVPEALRYLNTWGHIRFHKIRDHENGMLTRPVVSRRNPDTISRRCRRRCPRSRRSAARPAPSSFSGAARHPGGHRRHRRRHRGPAAPPDRRR